MCLVFELLAPSLMNDILASLEFGCKVVGAKIIVILGHTKCGAVTFYTDTKLGFFDRNPVGQTASENRSKLRANL